MPEPDPDRFALPLVGCTLLANGAERPSHLYPDYQGFTRFANP